MANMKQPELTTRVWAELALLGLIWGGVFLAVRVALDEIGVLHAVAHRLAWAAPVLWIWVFLRRLPVPRDAASWGALLVMGVLNNALPFTLLTWAQTTLASGLVSIFNAATALFGVLVAALFLADERLSARKAVGVALGFAGVVTAIGWGNLAGFDPRSLAQLAALAATLCYALAGVWARKRLSHLAPQVSAAGMVTMSAAIMLPLARVVAGPIPLAMSPATLAAIAYYAVIATALAYLLYYRILGAAGSGNLMLVTLLIPPVAITLGAIVRHEAIEPRALAGFALLAVGLAIIDGRVLRRFRI